MEKLLFDCQCKLCCKGKLPCINSHIFTESIIKESINRKGKANASGRNSKNQEFFFNLNPYDGAKMYLGRESTQTALDFYNKEKFSDEEIEELKQKQHFFTDRNLVCHNVSIRPTTYCQVCREF